MLLGRFVVNNPNGIHSRVAKKIAEIAGSHNSLIRIIYNEESAAATSILEVLGLGVPFGAAFGVEIEGDQAAEALDALEQLFEKTADP